MYLHVVDYNRAAIRMYEKIGFHCVGSHKGTLQRYMHLDWCSFMAGFYTIEGDPYNAYTYAYYYPPSVLPVSVYTGLSWFKPLFSTVRSVVFLLSTLSHSSVFQSFRNFVNSSPKHTKAPPKVDKPG